MKEKELKKFLQELLAMEFFTVNSDFSKKDLEGEIVYRYLLLSMLLLDTRVCPEFADKEFFTLSISQYDTKISENYSYQQANILKSAICYLSDAFWEKRSYIQKNAIPVLIYLADMAEDAGVQPEAFRLWWEQICAVFYDS
ncbi:MAG: hypothetical protein J6A92_02790 [Lachnospiraceae bacterium]|nr:hypothetical protein [Lachnospiraceae bacterium]